MKSNSVHNTASRSTPEPAPLRAQIFYQVQFGVIIAMIFAFMIVAAVVNHQLRESTIDEQVKMFGRFERLLSKDLLRDDPKAVDRRLEQLVEVSVLSDVSLFRDQTLVGYAELPKVESHRSRSATVLHQFSVRGRPYELRGTVSLAPATQVFYMVLAILALIGTILLMGIGFIHHRVTQRSTRGLSTLARQLAGTSADLQQQLKEEVMQDPAQAEAHLLDVTSQLMRISDENLESQHVRQSFHDMLSLLSKSWQRVMMSQRHRAIAEQAQQVAHDIRSPLTALQAIARNVSEMPEDKRIMVRNAVQRIDDIANDLVTSSCRDTKRKGAEPYAKVLSSELLSSLIEPLISEKRSQHRAKGDVQIETQIDTNSYGVFARVNLVEFKRVISNLVNNAVEAMTEGGTVTVVLEGGDQYALLKVVDDGAGIPADILPTLAQRGVTVGKAAGSGLGLYHARTTVESWGGSFEIASTVGEGTTITLRLPLAPAPAWFVEELKLAADTPIVILDDDTSIHQVWAGRFAELDMTSAGITVYNCKTSEQLRATSANLERATYLCDYELLGSRENGLDIIEELGIADQAILVSSRYAEPNVRARCEFLGVRMIPKGLASIVPIKIVGPRDSVSPTVACARGDLSQTQVASTHQALNGSRLRPTILVIDDSEDIKCTWAMEKERLGVNEVHFFTSMESCEAAPIDYSTITHAFLDKNVPGSDWDLPRTIMHLKSQGVRQIIVASGEHRESLLEDPLCAGADDILSLKVPQDDGYFLNAYVS